MLGRAESAPDVVTRLDGVFAEKHLPHRPFFFDDPARNIPYLLEYFIFWSTLAPQVGNLHDASRPAPERSQNQTVTREFNGRSARRPVSMRAGTCSVA